MTDNDLLYKKIIEYLKAKIYSGELAPGERVPTEMELAKEFSVSRITSKRALEDLKNEGLVCRVRGSGTYVSDQIEEKGKDEKQETNIYSKVISLILPFASASEGIMDTITGLSEVLKRQGYIMDICGSTGTFESERMHLLECYERKVGGIVYYPFSDMGNVDVMNMFYLEQFPMVVIDKYFESVPLASVVSDNQQGMYDATEYLLQLGHRKIAFLSDAKMEDATSVRNRYFGYTRALKKYGVSINQAYVRNGDLHLLNAEVGTAICRELVEAGVTAICAINDFVAIFLIDCLNRIGVKVPEQMSVVGFDDIRMKKMLGIELTSVRQNLYEIGRRAGEMIVEQIEQGVETSKQIVIPTKLKVRNSCVEVK